ncbi:acyltransferase family protein [Streptomyces sp. CHD11]|uniref:acyltransferase family protein n=1 Tax=Streptomyces sp. CHD11 TaxID=2741325 RepID=UPI001BFC7F2A|nr:acyltransferase family protein [Streptomyces sp. CHD11]MBT3155150.1 acyltransferase family protein [Streptomyces sp. CHD11]
MGWDTERGAPAGRRAELDILRALVVLGLVFFHSALVFSPDDDFYVKNATTTDAVTVLAGFGVVWAMPMLFLVAGLGARHSVRRRGPGGFARERLLRLGVPLVFGTVVLCPLPQWLRLRAADPGYDEPYGRFWTRFLTVRPDLADFPFVLEGDHFETGHLWFVVLLLVFCLLLVPVAARLAAGAGRAAPALRRRPALLLLPALPLAAVNALLGMEEGFAGWNRWAYLLFFVCGFAFADDERVREATRRVAVPVGVLGVVLFAGAAPGFVAGDDPFTDRTAFALTTRALFGAAGWCWVTAILGLLDRPRPGPPGGRSRADRGSGFLAYLGLAALPLYVLHQPVVVAFAYGVVGWSAPMAVKYAVIVAASLAVLLPLYEYGVRRTVVTRFLFGTRTGASPGPAPSPPGPPPASVP